MKTKAEILRRIRDLESIMNSLDVNQPKYNPMEYRENLGRVKALNWVLNRD